MNRSLIDIQKKLLPDLLSVMQRRFTILQYIHLMEPVGRRSLSESLGMTERVLRSEVSLLKAQELLTVSSLGMSLTDEGKLVLEELRYTMRELSGLTDLENQVKQMLGVQKVTIVQGNSDESPWVKNELGRASAICMKGIVAGENIIAVTGGTTMAAVADMLPPDLGNQLLFVPARGGIGEDVQNQANTLCAKMAEKTNGKHRVLYVPDQMSREMYETTLKEPSIREVLELIKSANIVLHGIGDAKIMAERRNTSVEEVKGLKEQKAVSEAFGYYFNEEGDIVHRVQTIGLKLEDLATVEHVIAVAGGSSKAKAIRSYLKQAPPNTTLITDEGAAKEMVEMGK